MEAWQGHSSFSAPSLDEGGDVSTWQLEPMGGSAPGLSREQRLAEERGEGGEQQVSCSSRIILCQQSKGVTHRGEGGLWNASDEGQRSVEDKLDTRLLSHR